MGKKKQYLSIIYTNNTNINDINILILMKNYLMRVERLFFLTPLWSYIVFSKHGSAWTPIKKVLFSIKKGFCYCYNPKKPLLELFRTVFLKSVVINLTFKTENNHLLITRKPFNTATAPRITRVLSLLTLRDRVKHSLLSTFVTLTHHI